jgi:hypothetical protein
MKDSLQPKKLPRSTTLDSSYITIHAELLLDNCAETSVLPQQMPAVLQAEPSRASRFLIDGDCALPNCCLQEGVVVLRLVRISQTKLAHCLIEFVA